MQRNSIVRNKNDLKACKMNLPNMDWIPIENQVTCLPIDHPEYIMPYGQTINSDLITDNSTFYCLNRRYTNPFLITNSLTMTWTQRVNTLCEYPYTENGRRCLGLRPDICVYARSKYILLKIL